MDKNVKDIKGIGPKKAALLSSIGIETLSDMLAHYPVSYEDRSVLTPIRDIEEGQTYLISALVYKVRKSFAYQRSGRMVRILAGDDTGDIEIVYFNASYLADNFKEGVQYNFFGKVTRGSSRLQMVHPQAEPALPVFKGEILPIYSTTKGISQKDLRRLAREAIVADLSVEETLPGWLLADGRMCGREYALKNIHFPDNKHSFAAAKYRIIYEELFLLQTGLFLKGNARCKTPDGIEFTHDGSAAEFIKTLSYELTDAQKRVIDEIVMDMESPVPMQRLVQGDVGSGKTVVAAAALYKAVKSGYQGVLMAPTELLAFQHYTSFKELMEPLGLRIGYLASGMKAAEKRQMLEEISLGLRDIVIGTHAVIQEQVKYKRLGLVITDEQHRFGVDQRTKLAAKGENPDILVMTATPIPRTLAVIIFGDLDISIIDELPQGRKPIETHALSKRSRNKVYKEVEAQIKEGRQAYVVAPLVEDSEAVDALSAEGLYEELKHRFPDLRVGLVHGAMKQAEKDAVMEQFALGNIDILTATVVIEVGINVPNATVMVIENAERFGLAQLHQLRGRVGRGSHQSYCWLITDGKSELGKERTKIIESTNDGFEIAEKDLQLRGPGDFFGTRQHGLPQMGMADLVRHIGILNELRPRVMEMLQKDPHLELPENACVAAGVRALFGEEYSLSI